MDHQNLIIYLIRQDLRQMQLLRLLEKAGFNIENFYLDILTPVAQLMGVDENKISDQLAILYDGFMDEAEKFEITGTGSHLSVLAEKCYHTLKSCIEIEQRTASWCE